MMKALKIAGVAAVAVSAVMVAGSPAKASLLGDTVGCSIVPTPFWICTTPTAVVGAGVEFELELPSAPDDFGFFIDIGDASIRIASNEDNAFGLGAGEVVTLSDLDWVGTPGRIIGITNFVASLVTNLTVGDVTFTDNSVTIDIDDSAFWDVGSFVSFDLVVEHRIPEPATLALLGLGLAGLGVGRRRKAA